MLASSFLVAWSPVVMVAAWLILFAGIVTVFVAAFRQARATGTSFFAAIGESFKASGQFIVAFF